jgi:hypothetical protein
MKTHSQIRPIVREIATSVEGLFKSVFPYGAKVFMDAHQPVTLEEGDRYPLVPPKIEKFMLD